jgi:hypothetical protein
LGYFAMGSGIPDDFEYMKKYFRTNNLSSERALQPKFVEVFDRVILADPSQALGPRQHQDHKRSARRPSTYSRESGPGHLAGEAEVGIAVDLAKS